MGLKGWRMMRAVGIIPARYGSVRFPGKPLADICGKPMVVRVHELALQARTLARVIVATDDRRILDAVRSHGGEALMTGANHRSGTDRLAEVAAGLDADLIVNIQGDEPLLAPETIDLLVTALGNTAEASMATLAKPLAPGEEYNENIVKVVTDRNGFALYFSRAGIPFPRHTEHYRGYAHIGIYAYRREFLLSYPGLPIGPLELSESLEQLRALENGHRILVRGLPEDYRSLSVDVPEDLDAVRRCFTG